MEPIFRGKLSIVSPGSHPLTKMLQDSDYEIEWRQKKLLQLGIALQILNPISF